MYGIIHYRQLIYIIYLTILPTALVFLPSLLVEEAKQGAWASLLLATLFGIVTAILLLGLDQRFPNKNLIEINEILFGKKGRVIAGFLITFSFIHVNSIIIREFVEFMKLTILPRTPNWVFLFITLIIGAYAVHSGLEIIARMADFIMPIVLFSICFLLVFISYNIDSLNLLPVFGTGLKGIIKGSFVPSAWFSEIYIASFLLPYIKQQVKKTYSLIFSLILISVFLIITVMIAIAVTGVEMSGRLTIPIFIASSLGTTLFFEHLDIVFVAVWIVGATIKIIVFYFVAVISLGQTFNIQNEKIFILPIGLLMGILSISLFLNQVDLNNFLRKTFPFYFTLFSFAIPAFTLSVSFFRRTK